MKRAQRVEELQKAMTIVLWYMVDANKPVKHKDARSVALAAIGNTSRREDIWTAMINCGFVESRGKGMYVYTDTGRGQMTRWANKYKIEQPDVDKVVQKTMDELLSNNGIHS